MCRSRRELSNENLLAKIGVDTAENEPLEVWGKIQFNIHSPPRSKRLHVGKLPLVVDAEQIKEALGKVEAIEWLLDTKTKLFYGSAFVGMTSIKAATAAVEKAEEGLSIGGRKVRVSFSEPKPDQQWPPAEHRELPRPPLPV